MGQIQFRIIYKKYCKIPLKRKRSTEQAHIYIASSNSAHVARELSIAVLLLAPWKTPHLFPVLRARFQCANLASDISFGDSSKTSQGWQEIWGRRNCSDLKESLCMWYACMCTHVCVVGWVGIMSSNCPQLSLQHFLLKKINIKVAWLSHLCLWY